jgi:hypothetical protein
MVRELQPFYDESLLHEDTEKCMQILEHWDFGFVHQVLSFSRADNESISSAVRDLEPVALDRYILVQRYAPAFLDGREAETVRRESKRTYYRVLAAEVLKHRGTAFWQYHKDGLRTLGETLDWKYLALQVGREFLRLASSPGRTAVCALRFWRRRMKQKERYS